MVLPNPLSQGSIPLLWPCDQDYTGIDGFMGRHNFVVISIVVSEISIVSFGVDWESLNSQKAEQTPLRFNESPRQRSRDTSKLYGLACLHRVCITYLTS